MKTTKTTGEKWAWGILTAAFIAWLVLVCFSILSCNTPRQVQKKDEKAVGRVLSKPALTTLVAERTKRPPDTVRVPYEVLIIDTLPVEYTGYSEEQYRKAVEAAWQSGNQELYNFLESIIWFTNSPIKTTLPNGITVEIGKDGIRASVKVKGIKERITDRGEIDKWKDSLYAYQRTTVEVFKERDELYAENVRLVSENDALKKAAKKFPWLWVILGGVVLGVLYLAFRKQTWFMILFSKLIGLVKRHKSFRASDTNTTTVTNTNTGTDVTVAPVEHTGPVGYIKYAKVKGGWQFQIMAANHEAFGTSQVYSTKQALMRGITAFKAYRFDEVIKADKLENENL